MDEFSLFYFLLPSDFVILYGGRYLKCNREQAESKFRRRKLMFRTTRYFRKNDRESNFYGEEDYVTIKKGFISNETDSKKSPRSISKRLPKKEVQSPNDTP